MLSAVPTELFVFFLWLNHCNNYCASLADTRKEEESQNIRLLHQIV